MTRRARALPINEGVGLAATRLDMRRRQDEAGWPAFYAERRAADEAYVGFCREYEDLLTPATPGWAQAGISEVRAERCIAAADKRAAGVWKYVIGEDDIVQDGVVYSSRDWERDPYEPGALRRVPPGETPEECDQRWERLEQEREDREEFFARIDTLEASRDRQDFRERSALWGDMDTDELDAFWDRWRIEEDYRTHVDTDEL